MSKIQKKVQVWIVNHTSIEDWYLILRVIPKRGGGWHPITGSVEPDEVKTKDWLAAAQRETQEETGIAPESGKWVDLKLKFEFDGRFGHAEEHAFGLVLNEFKGALVLDPKEHVGMRWVTLSEAQKSLGFDSQLRALTEFSCYHSNA